jgi:hypothetical protein
MSTMAFDPIGRRTVQALSKQMTQERFLNPSSCSGRGRHHPVGGRFDLPLLYAFSRTRDFSVIYMKKITLLSNS